MPASPSASPCVTLETSEGTIVMELLPKEAPATVENFLAYVKAGFYPGTIFHRVIRGFVVQGGGFTADGKQKPALRPAIRLEISPGLRHVDGAVAMARTEDPNSATSQFYICDGTQRDLDRRYAVFGKVIDGMDVVRRIGAVPTDRSERPRKDVLIEGCYEGLPDKVKAQKEQATSTPDGVVAAARKLRGRAALLRARKPLMDFSEVERAIARAESSGDAAALEDAQRLLAAKESQDAPKRLRIP